MTKRLRQRAAKPIALEEITLARRTPLSSVQSFAPELARQVVQSFKPAQKDDGESIKR